MPSLLNLAGLPSPTQIIGGAMAVALAGTAVWGARVDHLRAKHLQEANTLNTALHDESAANAVTTVSLNACMANVDTLNAAANERADALNAATAGYQQEIADLKKQSAAEADKRAYLQGMADKYQAQGKCPIDADLAKELNR